MEAIGDLATEIMIFLGAETEYIGKYEILNLSSLETVLENVGIYFVGAFFFSWSIHSGWIPLFKVPYRCVPVVPEAIEFAVVFVWPILIVPYVLIIQVLGSYRYRKEKRLAKAAELLLHVKICDLPAARIWKYRGVVH